MLQLKNFALKIKNALREFGNSLIMTTGRVARSIGRLRAPRDTGSGLARAARKYGVYAAAVAALCLVVLLLVFTVGNQREPDDLADTMAVRDSEGLSAPGVNLPAAQDFLPDITIDESAPPLAGMLALLPDQTGAADSTHDTNVNGGVQGLASVKSADDDADESDGGGNAAGGGDGVTGGNGVSGENGVNGGSGDGNGGAGNNDANGNSGDANSNNDANGNSGAGNSDANGNSGGNSGANSNNSNSGGNGNSGGNSGANSNNSNSNNSNSGANSNGAQTNNASSSAPNQSNTAPNPPKEETVLPYLIYVSKDSYTIAILGLDENGEYTELIRTFCTAIGRTSAQTRAGTYTIVSRVRWIDWSSTQYTPYGVRHSGGLWFHGPIYTQKDTDAMVASSYNEIGSNATSGCMRTTTSAAAWIYYNCPDGTKVIIANDSKYTSARPATLDDSQTYDPTDPDVYAAADSGNEFPDASGYAAEQNDETNVEENDSGDNDDDSGDSGDSGDNGDENGFEGAGVSEEETKDDT